MRDSADLTTGSVHGGLLRLAGPMVFGLAAVLSQSLVDTYFVAQLGTAQLAALSFTFPVALTFTSLSIGLSAGAASVVSRVIGESKEGEARRLATASLLLATALVAVLSLLGATTIEPLFRLLGASDEVLEYVFQYMPLWYLSMPFLVVGIVGHGVMRANGEGMWPSAIMVGSALINVVLTPMLMSGLWLFPRLGIEGVALATLVSRVVNLLVTIAALHALGRMICFSLPSPSAFMASGRRILRIALPAGGGNAVSAIGVAVVTGLLAVYGESTVAAFGVATRVEAFACLPMVALSSAIGPFSGQNWGADKRERVIALLKLSYGLCLVWTMVLVPLFWFAGEAISGIFAPEASVAAQANDYFRHVVFTLWGYGFVIVTASAFYGIGKARLGFAYYAMRMLVLYVPLSWIATLIAAEEAVFIAIAATNGLAGLAAVATAWWWFHRNAV